MNNILFFCLDSCRYDTFDAADAPNMKGIGSLIKAHSFSCFTLPSIIGYLQSWPPMLGVDRDYLFPDLRNVWVPSVYKNRGYANIWLSPNPFLYDFDRYTGAVRRYFDYFRSFDYNPVADGTPGLFQDAIEIVGMELNRPQFFFILLTDTHIPYNDQLYDIGDPQVNFRNQKEAVEFVDPFFGKLIEALRLTKRETHVIVTADHGDLLGPDGYGHDPRFAQCKAKPELFEIPFVEGTI